MSAAVASFFLVYLRAIQQQNVIHGHYWLAAGTSFVMAMAEVAVVLAVIHYTWSAVPWIGLVRTTSRPPTVASATLPSDSVTSARKRL